MAPGRRSRIQSQNFIPAGWFLSDHVNDGTECYTNLLGQKFYSKEDLLRYVKYAEKEKLSIYSLGSNALTVGGSKQLEARNVKPDSKAKTSRTKMPSTPNRPTAKPRNPTESTTGMQHWRSLARIYELCVAQTNKNPVSASVTDAQPHHALRMLARQQLHNLPTLSNNQARQVFNKLEATRASRRLAGHKPKHFQARQVTYKLEPSRSSRRLAGLAPEHV